MGHDQSPSRQRPTAIQALWARYRSVSEERIATVERAAGAALAGELTSQLRESAVLDAHKLVGSLGTFGFDEGSTMALEIEEILGSREELDPAAAQTLLARVGLLRRLLAIQDAPTS